MRVLGDDPRERRRQCTRAGQEYRFGQRAALVLAEWQNRAAAPASSPGSASGVSAIGASGLNWRVPRRCGKGMVPKRKAHPPAGVPGKPARRREFMRHAPQERASSIMSHYHAVVWLDHAEARIFEFSADAIERKRIQGHHAAHLHHRAGSIGSGRTPVDAAFLQQVAEGLSDAGEVLVVGPGSAKLELVRYLNRHAPQLQDRIVGVETADYPTDGQLVAHAKMYFHAKDRLQPQL